MARAFVLEPTKVQIDQAAQHGDIAYVFDRNDHRPSIWNVEFAESALKQFKRMNYDPECDYFVIVGHMVPLVFVVTVLLREYKRVRVLLYSATERDYFPRILEV